MFREKQCIDSLEKRCKIIKWMDADNSRTACAQEAAGEGGSKHSGNRDCKVDNRDQGEDKQRKMREQGKKEEQ